MTPARLRAAADRAVEGAAITDAIRLGLYDPSPEVDSLAEHLLELRAWNVPPAVIAQLLGDVKDLLDKTDASGEIHRDIAGQLEQMATQLRLAETAPQIKEAISFRGLVRVLRDPLAVIRNPAEHDTGTVVNARRTVAAIIRTTPRERLLDDKLRHELGIHQHAALAELVQEVSPA